MIMRSVPSPVVPALLALSLAVLLAGTAVPPPLSAQEVGVGLRVGSAGLGGDVGVSVGPRLTVRGGVGILPGEYTTTVEEIDYAVSAPGVNGLAGVDLHLAGPLRLTGGLLYRSRPFTGSAAIRAGTEVGEMTVPEDGRIEADFRFRTLSPYAGIGLGRLTGGVGLYLDLAVAMGGAPELTMRASDNLNAVPGFQENLERERRSVLDELPRQLLYPVVQVGVKIGL